jgi:uncharacterized protein YjiS (DUF1127 family)
MSTTLTAERFRGRSPAPIALDAVRDGWRALLRRREDRRALRRLWRLGPHLVRDAGLDPDEVRAAVGGGWEDLRPATLLLAAPERGPGRG